jgi:hypothetical protein
MVTDTIIENTFSNAVAILGPITAVLDGVRLIRSTTAATAAIAVDSGAKATIRNSIISHNLGIGLFAGSAGSELNVESCVSSFNGTGVSAGGGVVRVSNTQITNNTGPGVGAGTVETFQNNKVRANGSGNAFAVGSQQNPQ